MSSARPVPWVSPVLYGAVLIAGLYAGFAGLGTTHVGLFAGGLVALAVLDLGERRRHPKRTPPGSAAVLLVVRVTLVLAVAAADGSGLSRALFVLVPFTAYFAFGRAVAVGLGVVSVGLIVAGYEVGVPGWYADGERVSDLLMFCVGLVLAITMAAVAVEERRGRALLEAANRRLADAASRIAEFSATAERNRVARDIHDDLGHHLTTIVVLLEKATAFRDRDRTAADGAVDDARKSARQALEDVRHSVRTLRGDGFRLSAALGDLVGGQADDGRLTVTMEVTGEESGYDTQCLTALYRAAQEGITNARRHADATSVSVTLSFDAGGSGARLVVADDGRGFQPEGEGLGLVGMRERVELVGGGVEIESTPGAGTVLTVRVPRRAGP